MILDADTHISPTGEDAMAITYDELLRRMDRAGVDKALVWLRPPYLRQLDASNAYVYEATRSHPDRLIGFGWTDPHLGMEKAHEDIRLCLDEYGFRGVKLNGAQNSFYIDDEKLSFPLIEEIARRGAMLAFHIGADAYEHTHPFRLAKIARRYPQTTILAVHMGGAGRPDLASAMIEVAQEYPNLVLIGSAVWSLSILKAIHTLGAGRVCFGSDTPFELMHVELRRYRALLEGEVSPDGQNLILGGNIARIFNLE